MFAAASGLTALVLQLMSWFAPVGVGGNSQPMSVKAVCPAATTTEATCLSWVRSLPGNKFQTAASPKSLPAGYGPAQLRTAYSMTASGTGSVAVILAYDNPRAANDLAAYDQAYGLPNFPSCTTATQMGCFTKMSQTGNTRVFPVANRSWAVESDLDIEMAHVMCPSCRLTLVEANNASITNLDTAVDQAVKIGAHVVSMSWGAGEFAGETSYDSHFANANVNFIAASGDSGYGVGWPAASGSVLSAGGTHLTLNSDNTRASETVWSGTGSGCSAYEAKPTWQQDTGCTRRTANDLAADADPNTGAAIYSGYSPYGSGWLVVGGTSLATPLLAGLISDAPALGQTALTTKLYGAAGGANWYDVTGGADGSCSTAYLCAAGTGYDAPTGVGAPIGTGGL